MEFFVYLVIIVSCLSNMYADIRLSSGKDERNPKQTTLDRIRNTPEKDLMFSAVLGLASIAMWQTPLLFLRYLPGTLGDIAIISFAMYIGSIMSFHPVCSLAIHLYKANEDKESQAMTYIKFGGAACTIFSLIYTVSMIVLGVTNTGFTMEWYHYLGLPFFTMIIIQFMLGKLLIRVPSFSRISGTLGMMTSLLLTVHMIVSNNITG